MLLKIEAIIVSYWAILIAIIAYFTKDMSLAAIAFTLLVATELHEANSSLSKLTGSVKGHRKEAAKLRKRMPPKVTNDDAIDGPAVPTDHV